MVVWPILHLSLFIERYDYLVGKLRNFSHFFIVYFTGKKSLTIIWGFELHAQHKNVTSHVLKVKSENFFPFYRAQLGAWFRCLYSLKNTSKQRKSQKFFPDYCSNQV